MHEGAFLPISATPTCSWWLYSHRTMDLSDNRHKKSLTVLGKDGLAEYTLCELSLLTFTAAIPTSASHRVRLFFLF